MKNNLLPFAFVLAIYACGSGEDREEDASLAGEVAFELVDSVVVESLLELFVADMDENTGRLLLNEKEMKEVLVTDLKGEVISRFEPGGEGPNQVLSPLEVAFWKDGLMVKEMSAEMKFNFFNANFEKTEQSPALAKGLTFLIIFNSGKSFSTVEKDGRTLIVGHEDNALDNQLLTPSDRKSVV